MFKGFFFILTFFVNSILWAQNVTEEQLLLQDIKKVYVDIKSLVLEDNRMLVACGEKMIPVTSVHHDQSGYYVQLATVYIWQCRNCDFQLISSKCPSGPCPVCGVFDWMIIGNPD